MWVEIHSEKYLAPTFSISSKSHDMLSVGNLLENASKHKTAPKNWTCDNRDNSETNSIWIIKKSKILSVTHESKNLIRRKRFLWKRRHYEKDLTQQHASIESEDLTFLTIRLSENGKNCQMEIVSIWSLIDKKNSLISSLQAHIAISNEQCKPHIFIEVMFYKS